MLRGGTRAYRIWAGAELRSIRHGVGQRLACCDAWWQSKSPFGRLILVSGPEGLLMDRAVADLSLQMRSEAPEVEISEIEAPRLDRGKLVEITGPSLFSSRRAVVI